MNKSFINPNQNDNFSFLRGLDLQELLLEVENFFLEYRDILNLPQNLTFGVEIEYEKVRRRSVNKFINKMSSGWISKGDGSLSSGGEINSPVMLDTVAYWLELKNICDFLTKKGADTLHNAGGHIHIGANILGEDLDAWKSFIKFYIAYEHVLFRFIYGDKISARKRLFHFAPPVAHNLYENLRSINNSKELYYLGWYFPSSRYSALNFGNVNCYDIYSKEKNTLELRCPNATTDAVIWQNNINAFAKMLVASKNKVMDIDFLNFKIKHEFKPYEGHEYLYNDVCLKSVLEFVDLVFDNNLDKVYFLRQYIKDFQENYGLKAACKAKRFVK